MTSTAPVQIGDLLANKYRVERVLGMGGMGVVVQATHVQLEEQVALKFMLPEAMDSPEVASRFLREARLAVKLKSEHVAKVMDVGTLETGSPYIVMEFLEGTDLNQLLKKHGPLPFADVAEYVIHACDTMAEAHAMGIVHRDLKPANLFLTRRPDGAPLVKVLDFGISKASNLHEAAGGLTQTSIMMGSPYFMSPEQMRSAKDVDARSDVWSMGVILFQLLTARLPFESDTLGGLMAAVLQDDPAVLATFRPDVPDAFEAIIRRCLTRDRNCSDAPGMPGMLTPMALCSGAGACNAGAAAPCTGNVKCAGATACLGGCGTHDAVGDANCPSGYWCDGVGAGACQPQSTASACTADDQCTTGHCADGVCCNTACTGTCSACNLPGSPGLCTNEPDGSNNASHACTTGSACCAGGCQDLQGNVNSCGACNHVCPGYQKPADNVSCVSGACTFSCKGESYDVNNNPADGCEVTDTVTGNHTEASALNVGSVDECGNPGSVNITSRIPSDRQVHNPMPVGFDTVTGSAPDWFSITPIYGVFCSNDIQLTLTISGSSSPGCYELVVNTDKHMYACQTNALGSCGMNYTSQQYSDPPAGYIHVGVKKVCDTTVIENATYNVYGNI